MSTIASSIWLAFCTWLYLARILSFTFVKSMLFLGRSSLQSSTTVLYAIGKLFEIWWIMLLTSIEAPSVFNCRRFTSKTINYGSGSQSVLHILSWLDSCFNWALVAPLFSANLSQRFFQANLISSSGNSMFDDAKFYNFLATENHLIVDSKMCLNIRISLRLFMFDHLLVPSSCCCTQNGSQPATTILLLTWEQNNSYHLESYCQCAPTQNVHLL